ncbi:uncharacterized protein LOC111369321 isoform X1 [Olea europaea var. sylvestris]|uniref:uncharacterized protein LOC111369321 isoform X1 n=1 Tax=Olea europaea var. sylvestris TaxID=158386 RepID=UPI000C1D8736|nr:uncharacterized protein LOC111369321 isoform X1 [Olea europaea var. sylvestris]
MSEMKTLQRCRNVNEADNFVLIDVDCEHFDSVIIIDVPEPLPKKWQGSSMVRKKEKWPSRTVICIDDDESTDNDHSGLGVNENGSFSNGTSASKVSSPALKNFRSSAVAASKGCQFDQENVIPVRLSKCKCTYSGKASTSNRYGLSTDSESELSDNEHSDSELMEDSSGNLQQQWEEAFLRRMKDIHNGQSGIRDHDSASSVLNVDHPLNVRTESNNGQHEKPPFCSSTGKPSHGNEAPSPFITEEDTHFDSSSFGYTKSDGHKRSHSDAKDPNYAGQKDGQHYEPMNPSCQNEESLNPPVSSYFPYHGQGTELVDRPKMAFQDDEGTPMNSFHGKPSSVEEEASMCKHQNSYEIDGDNVRSSLKDREKKLQETFTGNIKEKEHLEPCEPRATSNVNKDNLISNTYVNFPSSSEHVNVGVSPGDRVGPVPGKVAFCKISSLGSEDGIDNCCHQESRKAVSETPSFCNVLEENSSVEAVETLVESVSISMHKDEDDQKHIQNGGTELGVENCIINEREKLKETDEYKRALEVEWASRQQALKIQAEEAQRLRQSQKRKKSESMRLQDMAKRQKQRVKEIRETQKKDVENLNMKEVMRSQVRKELKKLEMTCGNMASLLHSLGIQVGSWPCPSTNEVQSAYKRALLTFHPDRAPKTDIRQQVEAEEKFKLINRLKEELLPFS